MEEAKTQILFCSDEELEKRRARVKAFRGPKERKHLLESEYEQIRSIADAMILDGLSDAFTDELLVLAGTPGNERSFDFLRVAALIMGEDYVRSAFFGKVTGLDEACRMIREDHHEKQMKPFREIYDHLEEKLTAAREAEEEVNRQIAVLKMQNDHAGEMYEERLESEKAKHQYELEIMQTKAQVTKERLEDKNQALRENLSKERLEKKDLEKEIEKLKRGNFFSRWRASSLQVNPDRDKEKETEEERSGKEAALAERREFCIQTLGNGRFDADQIDLIVPILQDESIPLATLKILCRPELPAQNMMGLIRFIKGGKNDGKE